MKQPVFLSVGRPGDEQQEQFLIALEDFLRGLELEPQTLDRTVQKANSNPLQGVSDCLGECIGMIVLAYERIDIASGSEKGASELKGVRVTTVWNHMEASLAFAKTLPVLVLAEEGIRLDGVLENLFGWRVLSLKLESSELYTKRVSETLRDWKKQCEQKATEKLKTITSSSSALTEDWERLTVPQLLDQLKRIKVTHIWSVLAALGTILVAVATLAYKLGTSHPNLFGTK